MKFKLSVIFFLTAATVFAQKSQFPPLKQNAFKVNLLSPIFNTINVSYQRLITPEKSFQLGFSYMDFNDFLSDNGNASNREKNNIKGINVIAEYRVNFTGYGLNGFYAGPFLRYLNYTRSYEFNASTSNIPTYTQTGKYQSMGLGFILGKQFLIKNVFTIDLFAGPVYQILVDNKQTWTGYMNRSNYSTEYESNTLLGQVIPNNYLKGYSLRAGINIGLAF